MRAVVVLAHPRTDSLNARIGEAICSALGETGQVDVIDLYAHAFEPRLTAAEQLAYDHAAPPLSTDLLPHMDALRNAELLVLVFPTWWFGPPAILKGWVDRVFAPGIAYDHGAEGGPITPRLAELRHVMIVTTLGSPWWVDVIVMRRPVRKVFRAAIFGVCAPQAKVEYRPFYRAVASTRERSAKFMAKLARRIRTLTAPT